MPNTSLTIEQVLALLGSTPQSIAALTADVAPVRLHKRLSPDEWSANDVLAHMRSCADVWGNCMLEMIAEDRPTLRAINPLTWIKQANYLELEFQNSLRSFTKQRADLLAVLDALPKESWSRTATVTGAGKPLQRTVLFYGQWLSGHERQHVKQIERIVHMMR